MGSNPITSTNNVIIFMNVQNLNFDERLSYGIKREKDFIEYLTSKNIKFSWNRYTYNNNSNKIDGDIIIKYDNMNIGIDVKNTYKIYEDSILDFTTYGFYLISPEKFYKNIEDGWFVKSVSIKSYYYKMYKAGKILTEYDVTEDKIKNFFIFKPDLFIKKFKVSDHIYELDALMVK